jgi:hypothetical protein
VYPPVFEQKGLMTPPFNSMHLRLIVMLLAVMGWLLSAVAKAESIPAVEVVEAVWPHPVSQRSHELWRKRRAPDHATAPMAIIHDLPAPSAILI